MRDKGTFGIAHLLKETKKGVDFTICGIEYSSKAEKKTDGMALRLSCKDCADGKYNSSDLRSAELK